MPDIHIPCSGRPIRSRKRGFSIIELTLSLALVGVFTAVAIPSIVRVGQHRQRIVRQQWALNEVSNVLDSLTRCPIAEIPRQSDHWTSTLALRAHGILPQAKLTISTVPVPEDKVTGQAITCRLEWAALHEPLPHSVALTGWNLQSRGATP